MGSKITTQLKASIAAVGVLIATANTGLAKPVAADGLSFCILLNKVAAANKLVDYSDDQIRNGLCMSSRETVNAIVAKESVAERQCLKSTEFMMREFYRRFPGQDQKSTIGRC